MHRMIGKSQHWLFSDGLRLVEIVVVFCCSVLIGVGWIGGVESSLGTALFENFPMVQPWVLFTLGTLTVVCNILGWVTTSLTVDKLASATLVLVGIPFGLIGASMASYAPPWNFSMFWFMFLGVISTLAGVYKVGQIDNRIRREAYK